MTREYNCKHIAEETRVVAEAERKAMTTAVDIHYSLGMQEYGMQGADMVAEVAK